VQQQQQQHGRDDAKVETITVSSPFIAVGAIVIAANPQD
jgi:hypothetical protein